MKEYNVTFDFDLTSCSPFRLSVAVIGQIMGVFFVFFFFEKHLHSEAFPMLQMTSRTQKGEVRREHVVLQRMKIMKCSEGFRRL